MVSVLKIRQKSFEIDGERSFVAIGHGFLDVEIRCAAQTIDGQRWEPYFYVQGLPFDGDVDELAGWKVKQDAPWRGEDIGAALFIFRHGDLHGAALRFEKSKEADVIKLVVEADADIDHDETYGKQVPVALEAELPVKAADDIDGDEDDAELGGKGLAALLSALRPGGGGEAKAPADTDDPLAALAALSEEWDEDEPDDAEDDLPPMQVDPTLIRAARELLAGLIKMEGLAVEDGSLEGMLEPAVHILEIPGSPYKRAERFSEWLMDQPGVEEVYISDEDLGKLLKRFW